MKKNNTERDAKTGEKIGTIFIFCIIAAVFIAMFVTRVLR
jgi:hypothetical protein